MTEKHSPSSLAAKLVSTSLLTLTTLEISFDMRSFLRVAYSFGVTGRTVFSPSYLLQCIFFLV